MGVSVGPRSFAVVCLDEQLRLRLADSHELRRARSVEQKSARVCRIVERAARDREANTVVVEYSLRGPHSDSVLPLVDAIRNTFGAARLRVRPGGLLATARQVAKDASVASLGETLAARYDVLADRIGDPAVWRDPDRRRSARSLLAALAVAHVAALESLKAPAP